MRREVSIYIIALVLFILPACFYSDAEIYMVEPVAGDPPILTVTTSLDSLHNPQVNDSLEVIYQLEVSGGSFYYMYADVGSSLIYESDSSHGVFWIHPVIADSSGVDTLLMEFYFSTNSNSFADKVGYEALVDTLKYAIDFNLEGAK